jgi:hypothetical protein
VFVHVLSVVVEVLDLVNDIGDDGAKAIAEALKSNTCVKTIDMHGECGENNAMLIALLHSVGNEGARAIVHALESNVTVTDMHLEGEYCGTLSASFVEVLDLDIAYDNDIMHHEDAIDRLLTRNKVRLRTRVNIVMMFLSAVLQRLQWRVVHPQLLDICMAFAPLHLPPYVVLEVFDWLPTWQRVDGIDWNKSYMHLVSHIKKIRLIEGVQRSRKKVFCKETSP